VVTEHPLARVAVHFLEQPAIDLASEPDEAGVEHVGRIAHQREQALVAELEQLLLGRRHADQRLLVELPVAGVEHAAERVSISSALPSAIECDSGI
jgi:hypothetical protein